MLVDEHQPYLVDAIVDEIARLKSTLARRQRDVVFFVSPQSDIQKTVPQIARRLAEFDARVRHVFVAGILVAPTTPKTIFPRDEGSLLSDVHLVAAQPDLYELRPSQGFIGVYLDDAAITGRSLQDFMVKAANLHGARPYAIIAVVLVNRLSPREVRFLNACKTLQRTGISIDADFEAGVHFRFGAIFRLQVGMLGEAAEPTARHRAVRELLMHADYFDARLSTYADKVTSRMDALRALEPQGTRVAVAHPLCPCESERLSP